MAVIDGWTGAQMASILYRKCKLSGTKTDEQTAAYDYLNMSQLAMFYEHDWADLIVADDYITTDGSTSYNLASSLNNENKAAFGRVRDGSVRCSTYNLEPISKLQKDIDDPDRTYSGVPTNYAAVSRTDFRVLPYGSSGDTVYLDWVKIPTKIESTTTAANISFSPELHPLIVQGALWWMKSEFTQMDWQVDYDIFLRMKQEAIDNDSVVNYIATSIIPVDC